MGEKRNVCRLLVRKPEGKRPLGRPRWRWIGNIEMDLVEVGLSVVDWIGLAQDRDCRRTVVNALSVVDWIGLAQDRDCRRTVVNAVIIVGVPYIVGSC
jgi:hypothetical protein